MFTCRFCNTPVVKVMSFSKNVKEEFSRCPRCHSETRHIKKNSLSFGEILNSKIGGVSNEYGNRINP